MNPSILNQSKDSLEFVQFLLMLLNLLPEHVYQGPVESFHVTIRLRVVRSGEQDQNTHLATDSLNKHRCKLGTFIGKERV